MITTAPFQDVARARYRTPDVSGAGPHVRVSYCGPVPRVRLFESRAAAEQSAASGKPCCQWGCRGDHHTEELPLPEDDARMPELGYRRG